MSCRQSDLAREVGCSQMAVSLALRGSPKVSEATRKAVLEAAKRMGYRRNAFSSALRSYRTDGGKRAFQATLAWLTNGPSRDGWIKPGFEEYRSGAISMANKLGYSIEEFWYREPGMSPKRLAGIFESRGIPGILLPPQFRPGTRMSFPWEQFSAVRFGYSLDYPPLNLVTNHQFSTTQKLLVNMERLGYRRIGLAILDRNNEIVHRQICGAFLAWQTLQPVRNRVKPLLQKEANSAEFIRWLQTHPMDALITLETSRLKDIEKAGLRVPEDLGVGFVSVPIPVDGTFAGMNQHPEVLGQTAARLLIEMVESGERGIPDHPRYTLVDGTWQPGTTVRAES